MNTKKLLLLLALVAFMMSATPGMARETAHDRQTTHQVRTNSAGAPEATDLWVILQQIILMLKERFN